MYMYYVEELYFDTDTYIHYRVLWNKAVGLGPAQHHKSSYATTNRYSTLCFTVYNNLQHKSL